MTEKFHFTGNSDRVNVKRSNEFIELFVSIASAQMADYLYFPYEKPSGKAPVLGNWVCGWIATTVTLVFAYVGSCEHF